MPDDRPRTGTADALVDRLYGATLSMLEVATIHLGIVLGLYRALDGLGSATGAEVADRTGTRERYVREWLEQQAVAGLLTVDHDDTDPTARRFAIPDPHRVVLLDEDDVSYVAPLASLAVATVVPIDRIVDAFRTGNGLPYDLYRVHEGIGSLNRPQYLHRMRTWLEAVPDVDARLRDQPPARAADLACGSAWSSIALARAYPAITVDALDADPASVEAARANVAAAGLQDRVRPVLGDASEGTLHGPYDLVTIFEALHDMNHPVRALAAARASLTPGGSVIVADEGVADRFAAPGDDLERFNYAWSVLHCLLVGSTSSDAAATGAVMRPDRLRAYAAEAGFAGVDILPIDHESWRFYRLHA